jgi:hypothetical protein
MAKINTSAIEGYEAMSAEEKLAALEAMDIPDVDKIKSALDKATSEAAGYKKQLRERMSEEEAKAAKDAEEREKEAEEHAKVLAELEQLRAEKVIDQHTTKFMALGYDEKLARETAKAMASGDTELVFNNQAKFIADREKALKAEILKSTPTPPAGDGTKEIGKEDIQKMTLAEKQKFFRENPEQYKEIYGGN